MQETGISKVSNETRATYLSNSTSFNGETNVRMHFSNKIYHSLLLLHQSYKLAINSTFLVKAERRTGKLQAYR